MSKQSPPVLQVAPLHFTELERMTFVQGDLRCRGNIRVLSFVQSKGVGHTAPYNWLRAYISTSEELKLPMLENLISMK